MTRSRLGAALRGLAPRFGFVAGLVLAAGVVVAVVEGPCPATAEEPAAAFVGADACKKCHFKQHASWKKTGMAKTFESLKPGQAVEKKKAAGLDPAADFTKEAKCLKCHTTGYGTPSGYPAPPAEGQTCPPGDVERMKLNEGVTCEACHGPGSLYGPHKKDHPEYKFEDIAKLGAHKVTADTCMPCHVKECPTMPADYAFDFEKKKDVKGAMHDHVPLKGKH